MPKNKRDRNPEGFTEKEQEKFLEQSYVVQWDGFEIERTELDDGPVQLRTKTRTFEEKTFFPYVPGFYSYRRTLLKEFHVTYIDGENKGKVEKYVKQDHHHVNGQVHKNGSITFYPVNDEKHE